MAKRSGMKVDWKSTLRLPQTSFPMRAGALQREPELARRASSADLYSYQRQRVERGVGEWILHDGPPYANGDLHMGHLLNKVLKDTINRYHLMRGRAVHYIPGFDCHGLPIELKARHELVETASPVEDPLDIRRTAAKCALLNVNKQSEQFQRWGILGDWNNSYLTMHKKYEALQLKVFGECFDRGLVYRDFRPVHWSPSSRTALAEAELEYRSDHVSTTVYVAFTLALSSVSSSLRALFKAEKDEDIPRLVVWTTTPWTLPSNEAIAVNKDLHYSIIEHSKHGKLLIGSSRVGEVFSSKDIVSVVAKGIPGEALANLSYKRLALSGQNRSEHAPVLLSEFVTSDAGSSLVHIAPCHGSDDFVLGKRAGLPVDMKVDENGRFNKMAGEKLEGLDVLSDGNSRVVDVLESDDALVSRGSICHSYPYDWRTKKPVIQRATQQWFVRVGSIKDDALKALERVRILPKGGQRLKSMLTSRNEWCISRQRAWGLPIPVMYRKISGEPLMTRDLIDHVQSLVLEHGSDCWWKLPVDALLPESLKSSAGDYVKGFDTMDVWFDSGSSWCSALGEQKVADLYCEGSDQHRGWFQSSLLTSIAVRNKAPFRALLTHGFVLDDIHRKMSKSLGNIVSPREIVEGGNPDYGKGVGLGVDVLRMWAMSSNYTSDIAMSPISIEKSFDNVRKFRNSSRFMLGCLDDFDVSRDSIPYRKLLSVDQYALHLLGELAHTVDTAFHEMEIYKVVAAIATFTNTFLSPVYFDICKDRLYAEGVSSLTRRACQTVLAESLCLMTKAMAPILVHNAQDVYDHFPPGLLRYFDRSSQEERNDPSKFSSVFLQGWLGDQVRAWRNDNVSKEWSELLLPLRQRVNQALEATRNAKLIAGAQEAAVSVRCDRMGRLYEVLYAIGDAESCALFGVSQFRLLTDQSTDDSTLNRPLHELTTSLDDGNEHIVELIVRRAEGEKCPRCWNYSPDILPPDATDLEEDDELSELSGRHDTDDLCGRCVRVVRELRGDESLVPFGGPKGEARQEP